MVNSKVIVSMVLFIAVITGVYMFVALSQNPVNTVKVIDNPTENSGITENVIEITGSGFSPKEITIKKGEMVTWINKDTEEHWPASAMHPTHTVYPESDIKKCFDSITDKITLFDSCGGIAPGESYSFTFNEIGSWGYHDHIVNGIYGKVIVE